jgi:hypothetical protein
MLGIFKAAVSVSQGAAAAPVMHGFLDLSYNMDPGPSFPVISRTTHLELCSVLVVEMLNFSRDISNSPFFATNPLYGRTPVTGVNSAFLGALACMNFVTSQTPAWPSE